jgi:hypothetical protein
MRREKTKNKAGLGNSANAPAPFIAGPLSSS